MLVGYARVSTADQNPQLQLDALMAATRPALSIVPALVMPTLFALSFYLQQSVIRGGTMTAAFG